ncbi:MAG: hypothetical protein MJZ25_08895 [Fibrobacter sp.]|nr:hypothetical protein [Fibrobacter sp.]
MQLKVCKCDCHEDTIMYCMDPLCNCCPFKMRHYMHHGVIDNRYDSVLKEYATMVAKEAVRRYRERNKYLEVEFETDENEQGPVNDFHSGPSSHSQFGFERFNSDA